jgi:hypothetical protein
MKVFTSRPILAMILSIIVLTAVAITAGSVMSSPGRFDYGTRDLKGATSEEVGRFAQQYAQHNLKVVGGTPQVVLARSVTREAVAKLNIACFPAPSTIEDPPLMLVILKGEFGPSGSSGPSTQSGTRIDVIDEYAAYVFDTWSAEPMFLSLSKDGARLQTALGDPSSVIDGATTPLVCPTEEPQDTTLHYGDIEPTPAPPVQQTAFPSATQAVPTAPLPVPTNMIK